MLLHECDCTEQVFPDMMHVLKNVIADFHSLFVELTDSLIEEHIKTTRTFWSTMGQSQSPMTK